GFPSAHLLFLANFFAPLQLFQAAAGCLKLLFVSFSSSFSALYSFQGALCVSRFGLFVCALLARHEC
ncbi:MAG: hypothetical protein Q4E65_10385, partial [Clostridia bacterium]|nr:hypothetical protein [Clostridia bacterium]